MRRIVYHLADILCEPSRTLKVGPEIMTFAFVESRRPSQAPSVSHETVNAGVFLEITGH